MSFCPTKDIFSVYLDGEMPECYKKEFEEHVSGCKKCSDELRRLKGLKQILRADSESLKLDSHYLDQSFERLQVKMKYNKNIRPVNKSFISPMKFYIPVAAAAAAVFALVIPVGLNNHKTPVNNTAASLPVVASVNNVTAVSGVNNVIPRAKNVSVNGGRSSDFFGNIQGSVLPSERDGNVFVRNVSTVRNEASLIKDVDVFRPAFKDEKTISIKITVPGMNAVPYTTEIEMPVNVITGQF